MPAAPVDKECWTCHWRKWIYSAERIEGSMYFCRCIDSPHFGYLDWSRPQPHTCEHWELKQYTEEELYGYRIDSQAACG